MPLPAAYLCIGTQDEVWLVDGLASLLSGLPPAPLQGQPPQHTGLAATDGAGPQPLLGLSFAPLRAMPQVRQHLTTPDVCRHVSVAIRAMPQAC